MIVAATMTVQRIAEFLRRRAGKFFARYTDEALVDYIMFHWEQETLCYARRDAEIAGVMVGWQQQSQDIVPFNWQPEDRTGHWWYWHIFAADDERSALQCVRWFVERRPQCVLFPNVAMRHGKARIYRAGKFTDLYLKGLKHYGS